MLRQSPQTIPAGMIVECTSSPCVEIISATGNKKNSFVLRGCYKDLMGSFASNFPVADVQNYLEKTYTDRNGTFAMRACNPTIAENPCNNQLSWVAGFKLFPKPTFSESKKKQCLQCNPNEETCDKPTVRECSETFCYSQKGYYKGDRFERYGCTNINPFLVPNKKVLLSPDVALDRFATTAAKTEIEHYFCDTDHCNSASSLGLFTSILIVAVGSLFR